MTDNTTYQEQLSQEAKLWGEESERVAREMPPEWRFHRRHRQNVIIHAVNIDELLNHIQPGMRVLEIGCASGFMTLAMAQKGDGGVAWATPPSRIGLPATRATIVGIR